MLAEPFTNAEPTDTFLVRCRLLGRGRPVRTPSLDRLWRATGPAGVVVAFGAIAGAIVVSPWFSWTGSALSDLGDPAHASAPLFNGGLILAGLLGAAFGARAFLAADRPVERAGVALLTAAMADLALIGAFPVTRPLHEPVSIVFFLGLTYGWFVHGSGLVLAGTARRGLAVVWLGVVHATVWVGWMSLGTAGIAIPEAVGALLLAAWVLDATRRLGAATA